MTRIPFSGSDNVILTLHFLADAALEDLRFFKFVFPARSAGHCSNTQGPRYPAAAAGEREGLNEEGCESTSC